MENVEIKIDELLNLTNEQWIQRIQNLGGLEFFEQFQVLEAEVTDYGVFFLTYIWSDVLGMKFMGLYNSYYSDSCGFMEKLDEMLLSKIKLLHESYQKACTSDTLEF